MADNYVKVQNTTVPDDVIKDLCNQEFLTRDYILDLVGSTANGKKYHQDAVIKLKPEHGYAKGQLKEEVVTTLGMLIVNKCLYEGIFYAIGYINEVHDSKQYGKLMDKLSSLLLSGVLKQEDLVNFLDKREALGNTLNIFFAPTPTTGTFIPSKRVLKLRDELVEKHKDVIENKDVIGVVKNIENKLLEEARKELRENEDPGMDLYDSGAKASFDNNFKSRIFTGAIPNPLTGQYDILTTNLYEGIKKDEISITGTAGTVASYYKGVATQVGGYEAKKANAAYQMVMVDKHGTDCGTEKYREIFIDESNYKDYILRNFFTKDNRKKTLTEANKNEFIGKVCQLREPCLCQNKKTCAACAGEFLYVMGLEYIGLSLTNPFNTMVNRGMKNFHDITIKINDINENNLNNLLIELK